jgi:hypothetical protein
LSAAADAANQHLEPHWKGWLVSQQAPLPQSSAFESGQEDPGAQASAAPSARQASSSARGSVIDLPAARRMLGKRTTRALPDTGSTLNPPSQERIQTVFLRYLDTMRTRL